jgi:hypothetical protein
MKAILVFMTHFISFHTHIHMFSQIRFVNKYELLRKFDTFHSRFYNAPYIQKIENRKTLFHNFPQINSFHITSCHIFSHVCSHVCSYQFTNVGVRIPVVRFASLRGNAQANIRVMISGPILVIFGGLRVQVARLFAEPPGIDSP